MTPCRSNQYAANCLSLRMIHMGLALLGGIAGAAVAHAQAVPQPMRASARLANQAAMPATIHTSGSTETLHLTVGRSLVLNATAPLRRVYVGNTAVLQSYTSGAAEVVLTAKSAGVSSMILWEESGAQQVYTVVADIDPGRLNASLQEAFPGSAVHVDTSEGRIYLTGSVAAQSDVDAALKMASLYGKDVVNSLQVAGTHGKQVQLKLRIVEVDRTRLEQFGVNFFTQGRTAAATTTTQYSSSATGSGSSLTVSDPLNIFLYNAKLNVGVTIQDLEQRQILQVLAEPTLTTMSGLPARFLSGGEFPFPVVEGAGTVGVAPTITIQFRPYGVKVDFTPTVAPDGTIHLKLSPEVSALDYSNAVTISGFTIPALSTRRTETEVEIRDGQSFVVSGLLDHRTTEILSKVPGISNVPLLGQLFRSKNLNHSVVELVIIVTAKIVDPLDSREPTGDEQPRFSVPNMDAGAFDAAAQKYSGSAASHGNQPTRQDETTPRLP